MPDDGSLKFDIPKYLTHNEEKKSSSI